MLLRKLRWPILAATGVAFFALPVAPAADKDPAGKAAASKLGLAPDSMPKLLALIRPQVTEWRHLQVRWMTDVVAARRLAAKEDKPMVVLYTGGAGYNEPLGIC